MSLFLPLLDSYKFMFVNFSSLRKWIKLIPSIYISFDKIRAVSAQWLHSITKLSWNNWLFKISLIYYILRNTVSFRGNLHNLLYICYIFVTYSFKKPNYKIILLSYDIILFFFERKTAIIFLSLLSLFLFFYLVEWIRLNKLSFYSLSVKCYNYSTQKL